MLLELLVSAVEAWDDERPAVFYRPATGAVIECTLGPNSFFDISEWWMIGEKEYESMLEALR